VSWTDIHRIDAQLQAKTLLAAHLSFVTRTEAVQQIRGGRLQHRADKAATECTNDHEPRTHPGEQNGQYNRPVTKPKIARRNTAITRTSNAAVHHPKRSTATVTTDHLQLGELRDAVPDLPADTAETGDAL
jgi:hypothetical protein